VSFASAAGGGLDMGRSWRPSVASRAQLFAVVGCVAAVNGFAGKIATAIYSQPLAVAILDLGGVSAIVWFAIGILFVLASDTATPGPPVRPADKAVLGLTVVLSFIPLNFAAAVGLLLCGAYLALSSPGGSAERLLAGAPVQGNVVSLAGGQGNLYVALGCSSVHNMSLAVLLFVAVTQALRLRFTPLLLLAGAGAALMMATVNVMRLATLARFPEHFELFHTGWGGSLFGAVSFIAAGAIIAWGAHAALAR
jgi:exosortase/archaeosortase family protein